MRSTITPLMVALMIFQPLGSFAQEPGPRLHTLAAKMDAFLNELPASDRWWSDQASSTDTRESARFRIRIQLLNLGTEISVELRGGERWEGELAEATEEHFSLWVEPEGGRERSKMRMRYADIRTAKLPEQSGWMVPEKVRELSIDQKVEVLLVDDKKLKGRLAGLLENGFALNVDDGEQQQLSFNDVATVRKVGMSGAKKAIIIVSVAAGLWLLAVVIRIRTYEG